MKGTTLILLAVLLLTAFSPLAALTVPFVHAGQPVLGCLDVCHSSAPAISSSGDMPCLGTCPGSLAPALSISVARQRPSVFSYYLIPSQNDRPPQA